jgi:NadR type nicotinamide-nucleotide adenylyltransferase
MSQATNVKLQKIVVLGPESTGKSTLCAALAKHYHTIWCKEFAREYLTQNGTAYTYENLLSIAKGQLANEEVAIEKALTQRNKDGINKLIIDTDMYVMKVWSEYVFNNCDPFILEQINERKYDLYLLCDVDLPWTSDEMREYPDELPRKELFLIYKDLLVNQTTPWAVISGLGDDRINNAIQFIEKQLATTK